MMSAIPRTVLLALAVLAVGASQVLGLARGFLCECSGQAVLAPAADCEVAGCHGHHDDETGEAEHQLSAAHDDHRHHDGDHRHHEVRELLLGLSGGPSVFVLPPPCVLDLGPVLALEARLAAKMAEERAALKPPDDTGPPHDPGVLIARTTVLIV